MFSVVDSVLLHPYPYRNLDRLATFHIRFFDTGNSTRYFFSAPELLKFRQQTYAAEDIAGVANLDIYYSDGHETTKMSGAWVTANAFQMLGVTPLLGRPISEADGTAGATPVFAIGEAAWIQHFQKDPLVLGKTFVLNGSPRTLVAVMPTRFHLGQCDVWLPTMLLDTATQPADRGPFFWPLLLLRPGFSARAAQTELTSVAKHLAQLYPAAYSDSFDVAEESLVDFGVGSFRNLLILLFAAVAMLLLISCLNVANIQLAHGTRRQAEFAVRVSLGASRGQLVRQLLTESIVLAASAAFLGGALSYWATLGIARMIPPGTIPLESAIVMSGRAFLFCIVTAAVVATLSGLSPALLFGRTDEISGFAAQNRLGANRQQGRARSAFVVASVALSLLLLTGSGLMIQSFVALQHVKLGFDPATVVFASIHHPGGFQNPAQDFAFHRSLLDSLSRIPGVAAATLATTPPPFGTGLTSVKLPGDSQPRQADALSDLVSEDYVRTLAVPLLRGRVFTREDVDSARPVVLVNQAFATAFFGANEALGQNVQFPDWDQLYSDWPHSAWFRIIGVVSNFKNNGLRPETMPEAFLPYTITTTGLLDNRAVLLRPAGSPASLSSSLSQAAQEADPNAIVTDIGTLEYFLMRDEIAQSRFSTFVLTLFASLGLVLALIGIFSVMAYTVSLRTHEIGVRVAVGAQTSDIRTMILWNALRMTAAGIAIGTLLSLLLVRFIRSELWGVSPFDPITFGGSAVLLLAASLAACLPPVRHATHVDPLIALRYE
jgi:putative ABC transport system permease protein